MEAIKSTITADPTTTATFLDEGYGCLYYCRSCINALRNVQDEQPMIGSRHYSTIMERVENGGDSSDSHGQDCIPDKDSEPSSNDDIATPQKQQNPNTQQTEPDQTKSDNTEEHCRRQQQTLSVVLLLTLSAWECLGRYLTLIQKRMLRQQHTVSLIQSSTMHKRQRRRRIAACGGIVSQQIIGHVSEAVVTCQTQWMAINQQYQRYCKQQQQQQQTAFKSNVTTTEHDIPHALVANLMNQYSNDSSQESGATATRNEPTSKRLFCDDPENDDNNGSDDGHGTVVLSEDDHDDDDESLVLSTERETTRTTTKSTSLDVVASSLVEKNPATDDDEDDDKSVGSSTTATTAEDTAMSSTSSSCGDSCSNSTGLTTP